MGRLHGKEDARLPLDLTKAAKHRVAQLQFATQALKERPLIEMRQQPPAGLAGGIRGRLRAEQQQRRLAAVATLVQPVTPGLDGAP
jgi:hypothetical protein